MDRRQERRFHARETLRYGQKQRACQQEKEPVVPSYKAESKRAGVFNVLGEEVSLGTGESKRRKKREKRKRGKSR